MELVGGNAIDTSKPRMHSPETINAYDFWSPNSQETLIFSKYVGGAAIFEYHDGQVEILRVNKKYLKEMGQKLSEKDLIEADSMRFFDEENKKLYMDMIKRAIDTKEEQECETWRNIGTDSCAEEPVCIRTNAQLIGKNGQNYLFYASIRNITSNRS